MQQLTWNSPLTNRVLLTAGFGDYLTRWGGDEMPGNPTRSLVRVTEQCAPAVRWQHPEPDLSIRELGLALDGAAQLERVDDLRDRRTT